MRDGNFVPSLREKKEQPGGFPVNQPEDSAQVKRVCDSHGQVCSRQNSSWQRRWMCWKNWLSKRKRRRGMKICHFAALTFGDEPQDAALPFSDNAGFS